MAIDLCIWDKCNNNCLMCSNPQQSWPAFDGSFDYSYAAIIKRLEKQRQDIEASDCIYITGGEPTAHLKFLDILSFLGNNFPKQKIKLLSNARRFFYTDFTRNTLNSLNNLEIEASLYGPNPEIHDRVTGSPGSFEQTVKGLKNLFTLGNGKCPLSVRFVVNGLSYEYIEETLALVKEGLSGVKSFMIMFMEYEGKALNNLDKIGVSYTQARPFLDQAKRLFKGHPEVRLYHFPLCQIDKDMWPHSWDTWPLEEVEFLDKCRSCVFQKYCVGVHKGYLNYVGGQEFQPLQRDISVVESGNTFNPIYDLKNGK